MNHPPIKRYDPHCNYNPGDRVWVELPTGKGLATIADVIRQPDRNCDRAIILFDNPDLRASLHKMNSYFAVDWHRTGREPSLVEIPAPPPPPEPPAPVRKAAPHEKQPLPQSDYRAPILACIDHYGSATTVHVRLHLMESLPLAEADWEKDSRGGLIWVNRMHAAIKVLKIAGLITCPRPGVYRRVHPEEP